MPSPQPHAKSPTSQTGLTSTRHPEPYAPTPRASVLLNAKIALDQLRGGVAAREAEFLAATLEPRLLMGLHCLRAYMVWVIPDPKERGAMKCQKKPVTRDELSSPEGFEGWLAREVPWMKKPTAYKYMTALKGLGLDDTATEDAVSEALERSLSRGPVNLKLLCDAAAEVVTPPAPPQKTEYQAEFEFLRGELHEYAVQSRNILAIADQLKGIPDMHKAACSRAYLTLAALTGSDWQPSDTPDALGDMDPDKMEL